MADKPGWRPGAERGRKLLGDPALGGPRGGWRDAGVGDSPPSLGRGPVARKLGILPSLRPVLVTLSATAGGAATLWILGTLGALLATLAALAVYGSLLMLFRIVTTEDAAAVGSWVRQAICGWSHG